MSETRYAMVDVLDLAVLLRTAHAQEQYDGAVLDRVERAPIVTDAQLGAFLHVLQRDRDEHDRKAWAHMTTSVPSNAPPPPLPRLEDFDNEGHLRDDCEARASRFALAPNVAPCQCAAKLLQIGRAWAQAYKARPAHG